MNSLKSFLKNNWGICLGILCVLLLIVGVFRGCLNVKAPKNVQQVDTALSLHKVDTFRDKNDKLFAQVEQQVYTQAQVSHLLDSVAKALGVKVKYIQGADKYTVQVDTVYRDLPVKRIYVLSANDTAYRVEKHDGWNDIIAVAGPDSGSIVYRSRDTITRYEMVKTPIIGATKRYIYLNNANPYNKIESGASFTIKEKQTWLSVGPYIGYDPFLNKASIGIGVMFPIFNLKK